MTKMTKTIKIIAIQVIAFLAVTCFGLTVAHASEITGTLFSSTTATPSGSQAGGTAGGSTGGGSTISGTITGGGGGGGNIISGTVTNSSGGGGGNLISGSVSGTSVSGGANENGLLGSGGRSNLGGSVAVQSNGTTENPTPTIVADTIAQAPAQTNAPAQSGAASLIESGGLNNFWTWIILGVLFIASIVIFYVRKRPKLQ